jgi:PAS domain S-box-containing protein
MVMTQDVTEQRQAESALQSTEQRYKALFENAPDGVVLINADGNYVYVSPSAQRIFGYGLDELLASERAELIHPEDLPMVQDILRRLMNHEGEPKPTLKYRFLHSTGEWFWIESTFTNLLEEESVQAIVINFRDINEQVIAEQQLKQTQKELERRVAERTADLNAQIAEGEQLNSALTNMLEDLQAAHTFLDQTSRKLLEANRELEAFTYSVSHDLRAPLRAIDGFSRILMEGFDTELTPQANQYLNFIRQGAQQMDQLILDLLDLSRLGRKTLKKQQFEPEMIVEQVVRDLSGEIDARGIQVEIQELPACTMDPVLMKQVYVNLISNAVKFSRDNTEAWIEIGSQIQSAASDESPETGEETVYYVRDNGIGFNMAYADKIFDVFQRLNRPEDYEGTGIGLAIVKRIVDRHGGRVWAEGEKGKGAAFYFTLPE